MVTIERKKLEQVLEALELSAVTVDSFGVQRKTQKAITAIKEALAQPAQEPVAWMTINEIGEEDDIHYENPEGHLMEGWTYKPLYTTPQPAPQPAPKTFEYWNAVEGWVKIEEVREHFETVGCGTIYKTAGEGRVPVYTASPQPAQESEFDELTLATVYMSGLLDGKKKRQWVGLTDEDVLAIAFNFDASSLSLIAKAIEAKLKEKNT